MMFQRENYYGFTRKEWFAMTEEEQRAVRANWWNKQHTERIQIRNAKKNAKLMKRRKEITARLCDQDQSENDLLLTAVNEDEEQLQYIISTTKKVLEKCCSNEQYEACARHQKRIDQACSELLVRQLLRDRLLQ